MPAYRVTIFLAAGKTGASETYVSADLSEKEFADALTELLSARNALLRKNQASIVGVRCSLTTNVRNSFLLATGTQKTPSGFSVTVPSTGTLAGQTSDPNNLDVYSTSLQLRLTFDTTRQSSRYLAYVPDILINGVSGTYDQNAVTGWKEAFNAYADVVKGGNWFLLGLAPTSATPPAPSNPRFRVVGVANSADLPNQLGVVIANNTPNGYTLGQLVHISGFRMRRGGPRISLNGRYHVGSIGVNTPSGFDTIYLREATGVQLADIKVFGYITSTLKNYFRIQGVAVVKGVSHKRGRPSLAPRGRRLSRVTLDP